MHGLRFIVAATAVLSVLGAGAQVASADYDTNIGQLSFGPNSATIPGGTADPGPSTVVGFSFGVKNSGQLGCTSPKGCLGGPGGGRGATGRPTFDELQVVKRLDRQSPALFLMAVTGRPTPTARLDIYQTGSDANYSYCLSNVAVTSDSQSKQGDDSSFAIERVGLSFERITQVFSPAVGFTSFATGYDLVRGLTMPDPSCTPIPPTTDGD
jgi:type VI protein secretion system component Hcp